MTVQNLTSGPKKNQNFIGLAKEKSVVMCLIMVSFLVKTQQNKLIKRFFTVLGQGKVLTNYVQIYHQFHLYFKEKFKNIFFFKNNRKIYKKGKNTQYRWFAILEIKNIPQKWNVATGRHKMNWSSEYYFYKTNHLVLLKHQKVNVNTNLRPCFLDVLSYFVLYPENYVILYTNTIITNSLFGTNGWMVGAEMP